MYINYSNIEECLFDYFEGNLSEQDKVELMNFIHQNPEYERDFAAWAQSFAMQAQPVKDYRIEKLLVRKEKPSFYHKATYFIFVVLIVACGYLLFRETTEDIHVSQPGQPTPEQKNIVVPLSRPLPGIVAKKTTPKSSATRRYIQQKESKSLGFTDTTSSIVNKISTDTLKDIPITGKELKVNNIQEKDTVSSSLLSKELKDVESKKPEDHQKRKKTKRSLNLTPSSDFLPVNNNF